MTDRLALVGGALGEEGFDGLLVAAPANLAYLCGFRPEPHERLIALFVPREGAARLVCPSLEEETAREAVGERVELVVWRDEEGPAVALARALAGVGGRIGIEKRYLSVSHAELAAAALPGATLAGCDQLLERLRAVKSEAEIDSIRRAARIVDRVVGFVAVAARPGVTEADLAAECAHRLRAEGGESLAFEPLILAGPRSALPHGRPGAVPLASGDLLIVDLGVSVEGYCADITRTLVVEAEPDERQQETFEVVRAAQRAGIEAVRAGSPARAVDAAARQHIADAGYGPAFVHRTGHGLGLEVHEPPYLTATSEERLEPGMVVTVEPGIYVEGWGGIRIEDDVVVRDGTAEVLTSAPVSLLAREAVTT
jgi:Xaa-Pro dipeptidase